MSIIWTVRPASGDVESRTDWAWACEKTRDERSDGVTFVLLVRSGGWGHICDPSTYTHTHVTHCLWGLEAEDTSVILAHIHSLHKAHINNNTAGCIGLAVTCLTVVWKDWSLNHTVSSCRFSVKTTTIYSLGHRLHTLTAVPRSTQPSTLCGTVKWLSAFGLSNNNKWRWWVWFLAAYRRTHSPGRLAWS